MLYRGWERLFVKGRLEKVFGLEEGRATLLPLVSFRRRTKKADNNILCHFIMWFKHIDYRTFHAYWMNSGSWLTHTTPCVLFIMAVNLDTIKIHNNNNPLCNYQKGKYTWHNQRDWDGVIEWKVPCARCILDHMPCVLSIVRILDTPSKPGIINPLPRNLAL